MSPARLAVFAIATPAVLALAALSWLGIEKPLLRLKDPRGTARPQSLPAAAAGLDRAAREDVVAP
jgi:peptidoglycan/LPS O-acetylase OafA/YrhL